MENNNDNNIDNNDVTTQTEVKVKKPITEAHSKAIKAYYEKHKNTEEYEQKIENMPKKNIKRTNKSDYKS